MNCYIQHTEEARKNAGAYLEISLLDCLTTKKFQDSFLTFPKFQQNSRAFQDSLQIPGLSRTFQDWREPCPMTKQPKTNHNIIYLLQVKYFNVLAEILNYISSLTTYSLTKLNLACTKYVPQELVMLVSQLDPSLRSTLFLIFSLLSANAVCVNGRKWWINLFSGLSRTLFKFQDFPGLVGTMYQRVRNICFSIKIPIPLSGLWK